MRVLIAFIIILFVISGGAAQTKLLSAGFNPASYPGKMPPEENKKLQPLVKELLTAMRSHDDKGIARIKAELITGMGKYVGISENPPNYSKPDPTTPDLSKVETLWLKSFARMKDRNGWKEAQIAYKTNQTQPRLRVSYRNSHAYFQSYEANLKDAVIFLNSAIEGTNYMMSEQTSSGAFGYPYDVNAKEGLKFQALKLVEEGEKRGLKMTEGKWIIEDLEEGGLQFDNGEVGIGLLHAYVLTGDKRYLESARKAGDWAIKRPIVQNFNYNGYSGNLLARLYRVTGEKKYLDAAKEKFIYGVMPGQMENGRWFDQHNASIQYHALMMRQLIEFYLALQKAKDPLDEKVKKSILVGLDNVAEEDLTYGTSIGKAQEMLNIEAYAFGLMLFGNHENWERAANVNVNFLTGEYLTELEKHNAPMTETVASFLLYRRFKEGKGRSCEIELEKCLKQTK